jgi:hypothetical protein
MTPYGEGGYPQQGYGGPAGYAGPPPQAYPQAYPQVGPTHHRHFYFIFNCKIADVFV